MEKLLNHPLVKEVFQIFEDKEIFVVGGAVRDTLLNKEISDIDFATNLLPDEIKAIAVEKGYRTIPVGEAFGTVVIMVQGQEVQVTTYRKQEKYAENSRFPEVAYGQEIEEDLQRRDFTINAMAINNKKFADPFKGKADLDARILRTPQHSNKTFRDDPLRMIRAVRFLSKYGFKIDPQTLKGIKNNAHRVLYLSAERIKMEYDKLLLGDYVDEALQILLDTHLLHFTIPEATVMDNIQQNPEYHHKNVWEHVKGVVANCPKDKTLRWVGLLHDIGKPYTKTESNKSVHFFNHEDLGTNISVGILHRLKFSAKERNKILFLVKNHMRPNLYNKNWSDKAIRKFKVEMGEYLYDLISFSKADITSQRPERVEKAKENLEHLKTRCSAEPSLEPKCPISGIALMERFNLQQGKTVGLLKDKILEAYIDDPTQFKTEEDYYKFAEKILNDLSESTA